MRAERRMMSGGGVGESAVWIEEEASMEQDEVFSIGGEGEEMRLRALLRT
jgi:hypothetical protein